MQIRTRDPLGDTHDPLKIVSDQRHVFRTMHEATTLVTVGDTWNVSGNDMAARRQSKETEWNDVNF